MINVTDIAATKIKENLIRRGHGLGIQVGVRTTGCSGLAYTLEYVDTPPAHCALYESQGVQIWVDPRSLVYLNGLTMDWQKKGLNEGFEFVNPNESARCGCGESFSV